MLRRVFGRGMWFCLMCLGSLAAHAGELKPQVAVDALVRQLSSMNSLHAGFTQSVLDARRTVLQEVTGTLWIQRPGQFRWDTAEPFPQQIVTNGTDLWVYDIDLEQVTRRTLDQEVGNTPALLLSGDPNTLAASFVITAWEFEESGETRFDLVPRDKEAVFALLRVHFKNGRLQDMFLKDNLGQTTRIAFDIKAFNAPVAPALFEFKVPEGVDVITDM